MHQNTSFPKWKLLIHPIITFIVVFAVSRCLFPLLRHLTTTATIYGLICGFLVASFDLIRLIVHATAHKDDSSA